MQIHELTQRTVTEASIADRIKTGMQNAGDSIAAANTTMATAQQQKTQAQAAKYAQTLQRQGYGTAATAPAPTTTPIKNPYNNQLASGQATTTVQGQPVPAAATATTPTQPTAPATTTPAGPVAAPQSAGAVNTSQLQAGPVALGGAPAVMLAGDFNAALSGLKLNTNHIKELKDRIAQDASFKIAFLKALGIKV
jgi:hypothetical protein